MTTQERQQELQEAFDTEVTDPQDTTTQVGVLLDGIYYLKRRDRTVCMLIS